MHLAVLLSGLYIDIVSGSSHLEEFSRKVLLNGFAIGYIQDTRSDDLVARFCSKTI